ncbi:MAG: hypothetical protein AB7U92_23075 [Piscinibacter sp.]|uniref:hypothetical protein n=1 Tax=Piscinibacter sp. TaxID=1903157 RepID=UPI003D1138AF
MREAQADADRRFGDGPVQPWEPPPVLSESTRRRLAIVALASLLATALLVAMAVAKTAAAPATAPAEPARPAVDGPVGDTMQDETHDDGDDGGDVAAPPVPAPAEATGLALERHGAEWRLSAQGAPRHEVLHRLVEASGSRLHAAPETLADARPVRLHWQGPALAPVWPLVLGHDLSYALQCRRDRCEVWILGRAGVAVPSAAAGAMLPLAQDLPSPGLPMPMPIPMVDDEDTSPDRD